MPAFGDAPTPPMGWNSWNAFYTDIDEAKVIGAAQAIVDTGLRDAGYRYINIDDGWWLRRRQPDGRMTIRTNLFPSAVTGGADQTSFRPFTDRIHALGLRGHLHRHGAQRLLAGRSHRQSQPPGRLGPRA